MIFTDFHFHFINCLKIQNYEFLPENHKISGISCCHTIDEFLETEKFIENCKNDNIYKIGLSFGIHPQNPILENADFLETLLKNNKICGIGECGFDFYNADFKKNENLQVKAFELCLDLAVFYKKSLIIHNRKGLDYIFKYSSILRKVPAVIFHGFAFSPKEAQALLSKGINCYFSFGKAILNGNKKSIACVSELPLEKLLFETDAPFMKLKNEEFTPFVHIQNVYEKASEIRGVKTEDLCLHGEKMLSHLFSM